MQQLRAQPASVRPSVFTTKRRRRRDFRWTQRAIVVIVTAPSLLPQYAFAFESNWDGPLSAFLHRPWESRPSSFVVCSDSNWALISALVLASFAICRGDSPVVLLVCGKLSKGVKGVFELGLGAWSFVGRAEFV